MRLFRRDQKALEGVLQHKRSPCQKDDPAIPDTLLHHGAFCAQCFRDRTDPEQSCQRKQDAARNGDVDQHRKTAVGFLPVPFSQRLCDNRTPAGADHKARRAEQHQKRIDQVYRRKRRFSHKIGDKQSVYNAINRSEDHHDDGWNHKPDQFPIVKMF